MTSLPESEWPESQPLESQPLESQPLEGLLDEAARSLFAGGRAHVAPLLRAVVDAAVHTVPGADEAGICLLDGRGTLTTVASSTPALAEIDRIQSVLGEGPVLDAVTARGDRPCTRAEDLDAADAAPRWRRWAPRVRAAGFVGVLSYPLTGPRFAGALTLYARLPGTLGPDAELVGGFFADQAATALHGARQAGGVGRALSVRDLLGRAKGIIAERFGLTDAEAFALLVESANSSGVGLRDMATRVVEESDRRAQEAISSRPRPA